MRPDWRVLIVVLALAAISCATTPRETVKDSAMGLSKTSVFDTPDPIVAAFQGGAPGENALLGAYFSESPPMIPHLIEDFLPIAVGENLCLDCHDLPDEIDKEQAAGDPTPAPASHYTDLRRAPDRVTGKLVGARYVCVQCHAAQADAEPLVANTYAQQ